MQSDQILLNGLGGRELPLIRIADGNILKVNVHVLISCTMESPVMQRPASRRSASCENQVLPLGRSSVSGGTKITLSQNAQIYEPECHCCGAYLKPLCQEAERLLIVEIKIMFSNFYTD